MKTLTFKPLDILENRDTAIAFRKDSYEVSFGNDKIWNERNGPNGENYIQWLKTSLNEPDFWAVHGFKNDEIIAQLEAGRYKADPSAGHVRLYYLRSEYRKRGYGLQLHNYVIDQYRETDMRRLYLFVHPNNLDAQSFYKKCGWKEDEILIRDDAAFLKMRYDIEK